MASEQQISDLINHSGRLRMLSHRAGMLITFISSHNDVSKRFKDELPETLRKFQLSYDKVRDAIHNEPFFTEAYSEYTAENQTTENNIADIITRFVNQSRQMQLSVSSNKPLSEIELFDFLDFIATELLATLNLVVGFFEFTLSKISQQKVTDVRKLASEIRSSLDEVDQINLSVKMLSFNANVEAARAGEIGKGFAVVSNEMNLLSSKTKVVSERVKKSVEDFMAALES